MTDTTYSYVRCRGEDIHHFEKLGYELQQDDQDGVTELFDPQAEYGNSTHLEQLSKEGVVFCAWHGCGGDYGPCVQASDGKTYVDVPGADDGFPVVKLRDDGEIDEVGLREARLYLRVYRFAREALGS